MRKIPPWMREPEKPPDGSSHDLHYEMWGSYLSPRDVQRLEKALGAIPDDLAIRLQLIGYYQRLNHRVSLDSRLWVHVFWMIEHRPADYFSFYLPRPRSPKRYAHFKELWLKQVAKHKDNWRITCNAASCLCGDEVSVTLFKRALKLKPTESIPARRIAQHFRVQAIRGPKNQRATAAREAFRFADVALRLEDTRGEKVGILIDFTWTAIQLKELEQASRWAEKLKAYFDESGFELWGQYAFLYKALINLANKDQSSCRRNVRRLARSFCEDPSYLTENQLLFKLFDRMLAQGLKTELLQFIQTILSVLVCERSLRKWKRWEEQLKRGRTPHFDWPKYLEGSYRSAEDAIWKKRRTT